MDKESLELTNGINHAVIKLRGLYSAWSGAHGISYHEMLVLYTIREHGFCTQKRVCESYLLPKQTINNVIKSMRERNLIEPDEQHSAGREKAFSLTESGKAYAAPLLESLDAAESRALETIGRDRLKALTDLLLEYDLALSNSIGELR